MFFNNPQLRSLEFLNSRILCLRSDLEFSPHRCINIGCLPSLTILKHESIRVLGKNHVESHSKGF